jgi:hypothetical protein
MFHLVFFPWIANDFCERSEGFPTLRLFVLVHVMSLLRNIVITAALTAKDSLNLLQFLSLCSSVFFIVLSVYTLCIKVLYEKINLFEVVVVSREFAERAGCAGVILKNTMAVEIEPESNPIEIPPTDIETAPHEQKQINEALDDLLQQRESRISSRSLLLSSSDLEKTIDILKQQVIKNYGGKPLEYIPLVIIKAELEQLMQAARDGTPFDEARLDHLIQCMEFNDEYIAQKKEEERQWIENTREFLSKSLETMRPFVPVNIPSMTLQDLESAGLSKALARRIMTKRCLWLIRMSQIDIAKMHVADLTGKYSTEAQNLDVIELAAIYHWLLGVNFESDVGEKKRTMRDGLKRGLKEKMNGLTSFDELVKKRNSAYKNQAGPFTDLDAVYSQEVVSSEDAFASRMSRLSFRGLTRPQFDATAYAILESKLRSDETETFESRA